MKHNLRILAVLCLFLLFYHPAMLAAKDQALILNNEMMIKHDQRPTELEYALMSAYVYSKLQEGQCLSELPNWKVYKVRTGKHDHYGVVFKNDATL